MERMPIRISSLDVEITTKCNLACPYCYIGMEKLKKEKGCIGDMSDETIEDALTLIEKFGQPCPSQKELPGGKKQPVKATKVDFYGGEPLLSWERTKHFIERSWERGMDLEFSILSNGTNGSIEQINWLKKHKIWVQRSIDGHPEAQEKYRPNSIKLYEEQSKLWKDYKHSRRATIQPEFAKDLLKTVKYFESIGYFEGISPMPNYYTEWSDEQIEDFKKSLWDLGKHYLKRWKENKAHLYVFYFFREVEGRFRGGKLPFGCGGSAGLHCLTWDGWIYTCHRFSKEPHDGPFCFGSAKELLNGTAKGYSPELLAQVEKHQSGNQRLWRDECRVCVARAGCMKNCMHTSWMCNKSLTTPPKLWCEIHQESAKIIEWLDRELRRTDPDWWNRNKKITDGSSHSCKDCHGCPMDNCKR